MKVLITGATGFVGSHLAETLVNEGHEVYSLARSQKKVDEFKVPGHIILGDLSASSLERWVPTLPQDLDTVIHTAGIVHSYRPMDFFAVNASSTIHLFELLTQHISRAHFIFVSSLAAAGPAQTSPKRESEKANPVSLYGKSKLRAEIELRSKETPWRINIVRPPMVIGPRDPAVLDIFNMVKSNVVLYPGLQAGKKTYSFVNVFDLVAGITKLVHNHHIDQEVFYLSHEKLISFQQIIETIEREMNKNAWHLKVPFPLIKIVSKVLYLLSFLFPVQARLTPDKIKELAPTSWTCDSAKAQELLHMSSYTSLEDTVKITLQDYQQRGWI